MKQQQQIVKRTTRCAQEALDLRSPSGHSLPF
jgi:hypothetical protein